MQAQDQPLRSHRLHQHPRRLPRRILGRFRWQGRYHHALGLERRQALVLARGRRHCQLARLLAQPILVVRRHPVVHQDLRPRVQVDRRRAPTRIPLERQLQVPGSPFLGLVRRRTDLVRRYVRQHRPSLDRHCLNGATTMKKKRVLGWMRYAAC